MEDLCAEVCVCVCIDLSVCSFNATLIGVTATVFVQVRSVSDGR